MKRRADVLWRVAGDSAVLLAPGAKAPLVLSGSGAALWACLDEPIRVDDLARKLARGHEIDVRLLQTDVENALAQLSAHGLLEELA